MYMSYIWTVHCMYVYVCINVTLMIDFIIFKKN